MSPTSIHTPGPYCVVQANIPGRDEQRAKSYPANPVRKPDTLSGKAQRALRSSERSSQSAPSGTSASISRRALPLRSRRRSSARPATPAVSRCRLWLRTVRTRSCRSASTCRHRSGMSSCQNTGAGERMQASICTAAFSSGATACQTTSLFIPGRRKEWTWCCTICAASL